MDQEGTICAYCENRNGCYEFEILSDRLFQLFSESQIRFDRNALFCKVCINKGRRKILRRERVEHILQNLEGSEQSYDSLEALRERLEKIRKRHHENNGKNTSATESSSSNYSSAVPPNRNPKIRDGNPQRVPSNDDMANWVNTVPRGSGG